MARQTINLGAMYRDRVTGFTGIAMSRTEYLNGCQRVCLQSRELKDGKPMDGQIFDTEDLELIDSGVTQSGNQTSGPGDVPPPRMVPKR